MSEQQLPLGPCDEPDLDQHVAGFLASLVQAGYAEKTQRDKARLIAPFLQWIGASDGFSSLQAREMLTNNMKYRKKFV